LLVVIAVIAILAGVMLPALSRAKMQARATACMNALRQMSIATLLYAEDHEDALPRSQDTGESWVGRLQPYAGGTVLWRCARDPHPTRTYSYALNDFMLPHDPALGLKDYSRLGAVPTPSDTFFMSECADTYVGDHFHFAEPDEGDYSPHGFTNQVAMIRHLNGASYNFLDGHAERLSWSSVYKQLTGQGSRFVNPGGKP
jgi:prepilin-type processing-associated H-X9-DG protein